MKHWKWDTAHGGRRCGHGYCSDCAKRRGRNRGNRNQRRLARLALRRLTSR